MKEELGCPQSLGDRAGTLLGAAMGGPWQPPKPRSLLLLLLLPALQVSDPGDNAGTGWGHWQSPHARHPRAWEQ